MSLPVPPHLRLRKYLVAAPAAPIWPAGIGPAAFASVDPHQIHAVLEEAFPGSIAPCADWRGNLTNDAEYDPALCVPAVTADGHVAGFVQCWTPGFVKDLAVARAYRGKGVGMALMLHALGLFSARGVPHVDLKVETAEWPARRLYARLGFVEV